MDDFSKIYFLKSPNENRNNIFKNRIPQKSPKVKKVDEKISFRTNSHNLNIIQNHGRENSAKIRIINDINRVLSRSPYSEKRLNSNNSSTLLPRPFIKHFYSPSNYKFQN